MTFAPWQSLVLQKSWFKLKWRIVNESLNVTQFVRINIQKNNKKSQTTFLNPSDATILQI